VKKSRRRLLEKTNGKEIKMGAGLIAVIVVLAIICVVAGVWFERIRVKRQGIHGTLNVDCSDPHNGTGLFLALDVPISDVVSRKRVVFNVSVIRRNSHE
jgi:hypothetical protein